MVNLCSYTSIPYSLKEIARYLKAENPQSVGELLSDCLAECEGVFSYKVGYITVNVSFTNGCAVLGDINTGSRDLAKNLAFCDKAVIFCATIGTGIDMLIRKYSTLSPLKSLVFQCIGADRIENLCNRFCSDMREKYGKCAPRFSAGFGDFNLEFQTEIFKLLNCPKTLGVSLSEKLIMSPSKSVTAIMGIKNEKL